MYFIKQLLFFSRYLHILKNCAKILLFCRSGGMVDASDSKSDDSDIMWVQVPSPVFFYFKWKFLLNFHF